MDSQLTIFENSGHFPFIEEEKKFLREVENFLNQKQIIDKNRLDPNCPCPKDCKRHGKCRVCYDNHGAKGKLPYCKR
jgi:hypothetical protein